MAMEKHFIQEGIIRSKITSFLRTELGRAGYSGINIQKTPLSTRVTLYVEKPPLVIGRKGKRINRLTEVLKEEYGIENPTIDVQRVENPILDPNIVARRIAVALERGMNRRRVTHKAIRAVMSAGARGIEITLAGKIVGKGGRSRVEKYARGYMKKAGDSAKLVSVGRTQTYLKAGVVGVTVKIVPPDAVFPDQIFTIEKSDEKRPSEVKEQEKPKDKEIAQKVESEKKSTKAEPAKKKEKEAKPEKEDTTASKKEKGEKSKKKAKKKEEPKQKTTKSPRDKQKSKSKEVKPKAPKKEKTKNKLK